MSKPRTPTLRDRIEKALGNGPMNKSQLQQVLGCDRGAMYKTLDSMVGKGEVEIERELVNGALVAMCRLVPSAP